MTDKEQKLLKEYLKKSHNAYENYQLTGTPRYLTVYEKYDLIYRALAFYLESQDEKAMLAKIAK